ncbi:MAG: hypothetical protein HOP18_17330, partial [Deltaproteobacteria bacterium]|nr:hypothetical protein [Deltaproteobacteria bacterium]
LVGLGRYDEGLALLQEGITAYGATGADLASAGNLCVLAENYGYAGRVAEGVRLIAESLALVEMYEASVWRSEFHRVKGDLLLAQAGESQKAPQSLIGSLQAEAEACFLEAIAIARRQEAKILELRATMSVARLWQQQGKPHVAYTTLSPLYNWFTEGFDTGDLREAKALIEELSLGV